MLKEIYQDLEFIGKIPKNAKPNFSDRTWTATTEWFSTLKRRYKYERGEKGVVYIQTLLNNISNCYKTLDITSLKKIKELLLSSIIGLNNIVYTYKIDKQEQVSKDYFKFVEKIGNLVLEIEACIRTKNNFFSHSPNILTD